MPALRPIRSLSRVLAGIHQKPPLLVITTAVVAGRSPFCKMAHQQRQQQQQQHGGGGTGGEDSLPVTQPAPCNSSSSSMAPSPQQALAIGVSVGATSNEHSVHATPQPPPTPATTATNSSRNTPTPGAVPNDHLLPAPGSSEASQGEETTTVEVNGRAVVLDRLGPVVVGRDGTISRIANWHEMAPVERETALRVLVKRNQLRLAALRGGGEEDPGTGAGSGATG